MAPTAVINSQPRNMAIAEKEITVDVLTEINQLGSQRSVKIGKVVDVLEIYNQRRYKYHYIVVFRVESFRDEIKLHPRPNWSPLRA